MDTVAYGGGTSFAPQRPRLRTTAWAAVVAYFFVALGLFLAAVPLLLLGLVATRGVTHPRPHALGWPFPGTGTWCVLANAAVTVGILVIAALAIQRSVERRTGHRVAFDRVLLIVAATGISPLAPYSGFLPVAVPIALAVAILLIHAFALDAEPLEPWRSFANASSRVRVAVAATLVLVAVGVAGSYAVTHPLSVNGFTGGESDGSVLRAEFRPAPDGRTVTARHAVGLRNNGFADATLLGVRVPRDEPPLLGHVQVAADAVERGVPIAGAHLRARSTVWLTLALNVPGCESSTGYLELTRVIVRYRLLGTEFTQSVPLDVRPTVRCR